MTALATNFALIGDSFPSEKFSDLREASVAARAARRTRHLDRGPRLWFAARDAVVMPKRLSA